MAHSSHIELADKMQEIIVKSAPWKERSYNSPHEAIESVRASDIKQSQGPVSGCQGRIIDQVLLNDASLRLCLSGGYVVDIECKDDLSVDYTIYDSAPPIFAATHHVQDVVDIQHLVGEAIVRYSDPGHFWHRKAIITHITGREFRMILKRPNYLILYVAGVGVTLFNGYLDVLGGCNLLHWSPE